MAKEVNIRRPAGAALEAGLLQRLQEILAESDWRPRVRPGRRRAAGDGGADFEIRLGIPSGKPAVLLVHVKSDLRPGLFPGWVEPRRPAPSGGLAVPLLAMPFVSPRLAELCRKAGWGWLDLAGNCRIRIPPYFLIERKGAPEERRTARPGMNLGAPASGRVLRALLAPEHAGHPWTQRALQAATGLPHLQTPSVSLGLVNRVVQHLRDEAFLEKAENRRFRLRDPEQLLESWRKAYRFDRHERLSYFTLLKGSQLRQAILRARQDRRGDRIAYAAFSAAERQAPHVRQGKLWLYVDPGFLDALVEGIEAKPVDSGDNLVILLPEDPGVFMFREAFPGDLPCTNLVQTYLDLLHCGGRGEEAAQAVLDQGLLPRWKASGRA